MSQLNQLSKTKEREVWIDNVKVVACILVVLGHLYQSMTKEDILPTNDIYHWFNQTIYYFHVPLFFICSGYLYQKLYIVHDLKSWGGNITKKFVILGVPYFTFSIITLILKKLAEGYVNTREAGFVKTLFFSPTAPYWYLYVLFFVFVITPTFKSEKKMVLAFVIALIMKGVSIIIGEDYNLLYALNGTLANEIWFVVGMCIRKFEWNKYLNSKTSLLGVLFIMLTGYVYYFNISFIGMSFLLGTIACIGVISIIHYIFRDNKQNNLFFILGKYNFPIFLMHTIFAAGLRFVLLKVDITNAGVHVVLGIAISFIGPIISAVIMKKTGVLEMFLYPGKYIKFN